MDSELVTCVSWDGGRWVGWIRVGDERNRDGNMRWREGIVLGRTA